LSPLFICHKGVCVTRTTSYQAVAVLSLIGHPMVVVSDKCAKLWHRLCAAAACLAKPEFVVVAV
jgi:hypothetical protein